MGTSWCSESRARGAAACFTRWLAGQPRSEAGSSCGCGATRRSAASATASPALSRHLLTAIVETLSSATAATAAPWHLAWRDRVYLRDRSASSERDLLASALAFAADPQADLDRAVLELDIKALLALCRRADLSGIVLVIDDASSMTEDVSLVEELLGLLDSVGDCSLLMAGLPSTAAHFIEAASPCLVRFTPIQLRPFRGPHQIYTSLNGPLSGAASGWVRGDDVSFLLDVLRLTGGNPYELMLVGHHMWLTCQAGDQERYELTPRVLDRLIPPLALLASAGDALLDGAQAIDRLADEHVRRAVQLVALSQLTVRQIAIAQILKIDSRDSDRVDDRILTADIEAETQRILTELEGLQDSGVVQLHADEERFSIVGGRAASVLLKYRARARLGAEVSSQPFGMNFLATVGRALSRDATLRTRESFEDSASLGFSFMLSEAGAGRLSPRAAIRDLCTSGRIARLVQAEIDLIPSDAGMFERITELLTEDELTVALVSTAVTDEGQELEYTELWELPLGTEVEAVGDAWSAVTEEWQPVVAAADLSWNGSEYAVLHGERARQALIVMQRYAATRAVHKLFARWEEDREGPFLTRATQISEEAVSTMRASGLSERELDGELSGMLSRVGFLKSFDDALLDEAKTATEEAIRIGEADGWVTKWNLAHIAARQGDVSGAREQLEIVVEAATGWSSRATASVLVFVPGRPAADCMLAISDTGLEDLLRLQGGVLGAVEHEDIDLAEIVEGCEGSDDPAVVLAAGWVAEAFAAGRA
jgi:hypothetical protein